MRGKFIFLISFLVLAFACTSYADVVIGDFEDGSMDGWGPTWEEPAPTISLSTIGATSGAGSLAIHPNVIGWQWMAMHEGLVDMTNCTTLTIDVTWVAAEWEPQEGIWVNFKEMAINSDGPSGWSQYTPTDPFSEDYPGSWDPNSWGDQTRTLTYDVTGYDMTGATWMQVVFSSNMGGGVTTAGTYYIDNVVLIGAELIEEPKPASPTAAMIVNPADLSAGFDAAQKDRLESLGYEVTVVQQDDVTGGVFTAADAETYDVLVVSESIGSSAANNLIGANVPMMHQESYGWSRHFFTYGLGKTWLNDPAGEVTIVDDTHPIVMDAGLAAGQVAFFTDPTIAWTTDTVESLVAGAVNVAQIANADGVAYTIIFTIEAGTELADPNMVAANRVCGFSLPGQGPLAADVMTDEAWALFDAAIAWLDPPAAPPAKIVWVSEWNADADGVVYDQGWIDMLEAEGYVVDANTAGDYKEVSEAELATLESADLIIVSRNSNSGNYATDVNEVTMWNSVETPLILMSGYLPRSGKWQWINSNTTQQDIVADLMDVVAVDHPVFEGVTLEAADELNLVFAVDDTVNPLVTRIVGTDVGNGTLLAREMAEGNIWIAEWDAGVTPYEGTEQVLAGNRMYFMAGGGSGQEAGIMNFTEDGKTMFLNAVDYMISE